MRRALMVIALVLAGASAAIAQSSHLLIVIGLPGDPEHGELFTKWGTTLADTASQKLGVAKDHVTVLSGPAATKAAVTRAFGDLAARAGADDTVMIVLFGFGTFDGKIAKFNLPGPDPTPDDFAPLLDRIRSKRLVFVDTTSASGPFVPVLSKPGRVIVSATRNGAEQFATLFGGYFVDALSSDAADTDHDGKVTVLEAFDYAKKQVAAEFQREGFLQTEHALLDDNGDRQGSMEPAAQGTQGKVAAILSLGSMHAEALPADDKLRALYLERQDLERRIDSLKLLKSSMDPDKYAAELEKLATDLALKTRQIKDAEAKGKHGGNSWQS